MKKSGLILLLLSTLFGLAHAQKLPAADDVITRYINALGGRKTLLNVKDMTWQIALSGSTLTFKQKAPAKSSLVIISDKGKLLYKSVTDGTSVVVTTPQGTTRQTGSVARHSVMFSRLFPELSYKMEGIKSTVVGKERVDGRDAYKITSTFADGSDAWINYYDVASGLKVQNITTWQDGNSETIKYMNYKEVDGVKIPFYSTFQVKGDALNQSKVISVQINKGISDREFNVK